MSGPPLQKNVAGVEFFPFAVVQLKNDTSLQNKAVVHCLGGVHTRVIRLHREVSAFRLRRVSPLHHILLPRAREFVMNGVRFIIDVGLISNGMGRDIRMESPPNRSRSQRGSSRSPTSLMLFRAVASTSAPLPKRMCSLNWMPEAVRISTQSWSISSSGSCLRCARFWASTLTTHLDLLLRSGRPDEHPRA